MSSGDDTFPPLARSLTLSAADGPQSLRKPRNTTFRQFPYSDKLNTETIATTNTERTPANNYVTNTLSAPSQAL